MKAMRHVCLAAAVGILALTGCDAASPPGGASSGSVERAPSAPGGALLAALRDPDPYARARSLGALLPTLGPGAVPEVERALGDSKLELGAAEYELLVRFWASQAPEAATRWVVDRSPIYHRNNLVLIALPAWVAT